MIETQRTKITSIEKESIELKHKLSEINEEIKSKDIELIKKNKLIKKQNRKIRNQKKALETKTTILEEQIISISEKNDLLNQIYGSKGWKMLSKYYRSRDYLFLKLNLKRIISNLLFISKAIFRKKILNKRIILHCDKMEFNCNTIDVSGWAASDAGIDRIEVYLNQKFIGKAIHSQLRPDFQKAHTHIKNSYKARFFLFLPNIVTLNKSFNEITIHVKAVDKSGRNVIFSRKIKKSFADYEIWINNNLPDYRFQETQKNTIFKYLPKISIVIPINNIETYLLEKCINSVLRQSYKNWELCLVDYDSQANQDKSIIEFYHEMDRRIQYKFIDKNSGFSKASNEGIGMASGQFVVLLNNNDEITPDALYEIVKRLNESPDTDIIYTDQDTISYDGRLFEPFFKPDWSPEFFKGVMYVDHLLAIRKKTLDKTSLFNKKYDFLQDYELLLRLSETTNNIEHIRKILYHSRQIKENIEDRQNSKGELNELQEKAVNEHLQRTKSNGYAKNEGVPHRLHIYPKLKNQYPLISIIITVENAPELLKKCISSIYEVSTYPNFQVILVDNTIDPESLKCIRTYPVTIVEFNEKFNLSAANNLGAKHAAGEYIVFLNNETEIITRSWLQNLLYYVEQIDIAAASPLLIYPNGNVQHAGFVLGVGGTADHVMRNFAHDDDGYYGSLYCAREISSVTAACMMVKKSLFFKVGGFNAYYSLYYQDVDFCLKLRKLKFRIIYAPTAVLKHHESVSRRDDYQVLDRILLLDQWEDVINIGDPYYNPNFNLKEYSTPSTGYKLKNNESDL